MASPIASLLEGRLRDPEPLGEDAFVVLSQLSRLVGSDAQEDDQDQDIQRLVLRALERSDEFGAAGAALAQLVRLRGLYPYLPSEEMSFSDALAVELHRPANLNDVVFHKVQAEVYHYLTGGENVILSAPTSFGKSLIIDAVIATQNHDNIVVVVPTIALIDETRRRLVQRFRDSYKVITHPSQAPSARNIYILTQERVVDHKDLTNVDFFVIDEFYKLDPRQDADRAMLLNQAFYRLHRSGAQFYMLGPSIRNLPVELPEKLRFRFIATDYATVVSQYHRIRSTSVDRHDKLLELAQRLTDQTIIYCASPASARRVASALAAVSTPTESPEVNAAAQWASERYHPDWAFARALRKGIGLHHGKVPRALQQFVVKAFNEGKLSFLVCTSTLIEGVNTKAKSIVIFDNKIARKKYDFFTFNNIRGRSGRMFQHFIGDVYLFYDPPPEDLPMVDLPVITQGERTPPSLLIQIDDADLAPTAKERIRPLLEQSLVPLSVLRANSGIDPTAQVALAEHLRSNSAQVNELLRWRGMPTYPELQAASLLIWQFLVQARGLLSGVASGQQLAFRINRFRFHRDTRRLVLEELSAQGAEPDADDAVEGVLDFVRFWPTFTFPKLLMALSRIQETVFRSLRMPFGDYSVFAIAVESSFLPPGIAALDEYGIPLELGQKLAPYLRSPESLDEALVALRSVPSRPPGLDLFEQIMLRYAQDGI